MRDLTPTAFSPPAILLSDQEGGSSGQGFDPSQFLPSNSAGGSPLPSDSLGGANSHSDVMDSTPSPLLHHRPSNGSGDMEDDSQDGEFGSNDGDSFVENVEDDDLAQPVTVKVEEASAAPPV